MHLLLFADSGRRIIACGTGKSSICPLVLVPQAGIAPMRHRETVSRTRLHYVATVSLPRFFTGAVKCPATTVCLSKGLAILKLEFMISKCQVPEASVAQMRQYYLTRVGEQRLITLSRLSLAETIVYSSAMSKACLRLREACKGPDSESRSTVPRALLLELDST